MTVTVSGLNPIYIYSLIKVYSLMKGFWKPGLDKLRAFAVQAEVEDLQKSLALALIDWVPKGSNVVPFGQYIIIPTKDKPEGKRNYIGACSSTDFFYRTFYGT